MNTVAAATVFKVSDQYRQAPVTGEIHRWIHHSSSDRHEGTAGERRSAQATGYGVGASLKDTEPVIADIQHLDCSYTHTQIRLE